MKLQLEQFKDLDKLEIIAREVVEGFITGLHKSPYHGFSVEFAEHRLYNTGESTKHIDWKLFAKTDKLFVKRYEEETNLRCQILIDTSSSMLYPYRSRRTSKLAFAGLSAAALIYLMRKQRDGVGLSFFADKLELHTPAKLADTHLKMLYTELDKLIYEPNRELSKTGSSPKLFHQLSEQLHTRSLIIIFSDLNEWMQKGSADEFFNALQHFRYNKHEVVVFSLVDSTDELSFDFDSRPTQFIDLETGSEIRLNPADIRQQFREQMQTYYNDIRLTCARFEIDFIQADIHTDFREVLGHYLIKRSKMY